MKLLFLFLPTLLISSHLNILKPDYFTKENYCVVTSKKQKYLGLLRFKNKNDFKIFCNGKMIFKYKKKECRTFTMKGMKFNIYISDTKNKYYFKIDEKKTLCDKTIIESI